MPTPGDLVKKLKDVTPDMLASSTPASSAPTSSAPTSSAPVSSTLAEQLADQDMPPPMADMPDHMADHMVPAPSAPSSPQLASPATGTRKYDPDGTNIRRPRGIETG
jgi:hypothetical protein